MMVSFKKVKADIYGNYLFFNWDGLHNKTPELISKYRRRYYFKL